MWYPFNLEIAVMRDQTKLYYHEKYNAFLRNNSVYYTL